MSLSPTSPPSSSHCPLLSLPPELRLHIFSHIYTHPHRCTLQIENQTLSYQFQDKDSHTPMEPLRTCRQLHQEVLPIVYSLTTFKLIIFGTEQPPSGKGYEQFLWPRDTRRCLRHARKLELFVHIFEPKDLNLVVQRLVAVARQIPQERNLEACTVQFAFHVTTFDPGSTLPKLRCLSQATLDAVAQLGQRAGLSVAERHVSKKVKAEAVRVVQKYAVMNDSTK